VRKSFITVIVLSSSSKDEGEEAKKKRAEDLAWAQRQKDTMLSYLPAIKQ
jgi:hypothetical protein